MSSQSGLDVDSHSILYPWPFYQMSSIKKRFMVFCRYSFKSWGILNEMSLANKFRVSNAVLAFVLNTSQWFLNA